MEDLTVPFHDNQIEGSKLFYKSAFKNSKATLASITVNFEDVFSITNAWNFGPGTLDDLSNLTHLRLEHYDFKVEFLHQFCHHCKNFPLVVRVYMLCEFNQNISLQIDKKISFLSIFKVV